MPANTVLTVTFHSDPGHGWIEVPKPILRGVLDPSEISQFSYQDNENYYLEEDVDAGKFLAAVEDLGVRVDIYDKSVEHEHPIRRKSRVV